MSVAVKSSAPVRSLEQRRAALERANEVRSYRAQLKGRIKGCEQEPVAVLADPVDLVDTMKVYELLLAIPKYGRVKVNKILARAHISPSKTVGGLTERQRRELMLFLPKR